MDERTYRTMVVAAGVILIAAMIRISPPDSKVFVAILIGLMIAPLVISALAQ